MSKIMNEEKANKELEKRYDDAEVILSDPDKTEELLESIEKKLKLIPFAGEKLSQIPTLVMLVRKYIKKEYTTIPVGSIIAAVAALLYFFSPFDFLPDSIPLLGYFDDAAVVGLCWKLISSDVEDFITWRDNNIKIGDGATVIINSEEGDKD